MFQEAPADTVVSVYVSESFLEKPEHEKCLQGYRYEVVSDAVFREISDTQTPQGILAIVRMPKYDLPDLLQDHTHLLILERAGSGKSWNDGAHRRGCRHHGNYNE